MGIDALMKSLVSGACKDLVGKDRGKKIKAENWFKDRWELEDYIFSYPSVADHLGLAMTGKAVIEKAKATREEGGK